MMLYKVSKQHQTVFEIIILYIMLLPYIKANPAVDSDEDCDRKCMERKSRIEIIKNEILQRLGMDRAPNRSFTLPANFTPPFVTTDVRSTTRIPDSNSTAAPCTSGPARKTYKYPATGNTTNSNILQFMLEGPQGENVRVTRATLNVLIKYRKNKDKKLKKRNKKISLNIYKLLSADENERLVTTMNVAVRHTEWRQITIPTYVVEEAYRGDDRLLQLKIVCNNCDQNGPQIVTLFKNNKIRSSKKKLNKKRRNREKRERQHKTKKYHKKRPYLEVRIRTKRRPKRQLRESYKPVKKSNLLKVLKVNKR